MGLGGRGQQDSRLGQGQLGLRQPQLHGSIHTCLHNGDRLGVRHPHILAGGAQQPPAGGDEVPRLQKAGQVVERRIRVAAPEGLHQGGGGVVHGVAASVVPHGAALGHLLHVVQGQHQLPISGHGCPAQKFHRIDGLADVAAAGGGDLPGHILLPVQGQGRTVLLDLQCPQDSGFHLLRRHGLELKHRAAGQQGSVHIKVRVLRGGGDEGQRAVLHEFQQALLLLLIEVLNLVQVQQNAPWGQQRPHVGNDVLHVLQGCGGGVEPVEGLIGLPGDDVGDGGLSGAGGAVEHHIRLRAAVDQPPEHGAGGEQMPLAHHLVQCFGADLIRKRPLHGGTPFPVDLGTFIIAWPIGNFHRENAKKPGRQSVLPAFGL